MEVAIKGLIDLLCAAAKLLPRLGQWHLAMWCIEQAMSLERSARSSSRGREARLPPAPSPATSISRTLVYIAALKPKNARIWQWLGQLHAEIGQWGQAENAFRRSLCAGAMQALVHTALANVLLEQDRISEANEACRMALAHDDHDASACKSLASILIRQKRLTEAQEACDEALRIRPDYTEGLALAGLLHAMANRPSESFVCLDRAISLDPACFYAYCYRAQVRMRQGEYEAALSDARTAIRLKPWLAGPYAVLGSIHLATGELDTAEAACRRALEIDDGKAEHHGNLGNVFYKKADLQQAATEFRNAIRLDPSLTESHKNLGTVLQDTGDFAGAISSYKRAIEIRPCYGDPHRLLAFVRQHATYDDEIRAMETLASDSQVSEQDLMHVSFGLGKAYDDLKKYDTAFKHYLLGNRLKRKTFRYSVEDDARFFAEIKDVFTSQFCQDRHSAGCLNETPVFVLGMPRSGTTLVEQILAGHPKIVAAGELHHIDVIAHEVLPKMAKHFGCKAERFPSLLQEIEPTRYKELGQIYVNQIKHMYYESAKVIDKMPFNFRYVGLLKLMLPGCKIIHCKRSPLDTGVSVFKSYFTGNVNFAYDLEEIGHYYNLYKDLMIHWERVLPRSIHTVEYENLVLDQRGETKKLCDFLELPWEEITVKHFEVDRPVRTASALQVRRPIYRSSLGSWRRYESHVEPLVHAISRRARLPDRATSG